MKRVVIIGSGNLAEALARAVAESNLQLVQIYARNAERARAVATLAATRWTTQPAELADADIYLVSVSDRAVAEVAAALPLPAHACVAHTAGSVPLDVLPGRCAHRAVFYPMQTFTKGRRVDFAQIPIFLECDDEAFYPELEAFARQLSQTVIRADSARRAKIHLAAVFACNFANHMYALGEQIARSPGLASGVRNPPAGGPAGKALAAASPADVQTGPAVRHDLATQERHLRLLGDDMQLKEIYSTISQHIWETSRKR